MRTLTLNTVQSTSLPRWNRAYARALAPRKHLRVLPTRTRPSLFGSD